MYHAVIIDDEMLFLRYLTAQINWRRYGIEVDGAYSSAKQALEAMRDAPVDLIVTDIKMPGMSGIDFLRALPAHVRMHTFILVLSGYSDFQLVREAFLAGASDYLLKSDVSTPAFDKIMDNVMAYLNARPSGDDPAKTGDISSNLTRQVKDYIRQNLSGSLSLGEIAARFGFSPGYLSQLFSNREGVTLSEYIVGLRIDSAKQLLRETDQSVTEILYRVGFNSPEHFSRTFRKLIGMSPREYRSKNAQK